MARLSYLTESESQDFKESSNIRKRYTQDSGDHDLVIESLSEISGIGEKVQKALVDHFGTELWR